MKLVFLDFDGVLNSRRFFRATRGKGGGPLGEVGALSPTMVGRLNRIVEATGARIVVSSSWRHGHTVAELHAILCKRGFRGTVLGKTPDYADCCGRDSVDDRLAAGCAGSPRGHEIREWLDRWPVANGARVESYVVLDDNGDMDGVRDRFIQTSFDTGLTDDHVETVIEMLGRLDESAGGGES